MGKPSKEEALKALQAAPVGTTFKADYGWSITKVQAANKAVSYRYEYLDPKTGLAKRQAEFIKDPSVLAGDVAVIPPGLETQRTTSRAAAPATQTRTQPAATVSPGSKEEKSNDDLKKATFKTAVNPQIQGTTQNTEFAINRKFGDTFNIARFRAQVSNIDDVLPNHSFLVAFSPMDWILELPSAERAEIYSLLTMRCDNAVLPSINLLQEQNIRRYGFGPVENVPYGVNVGDFTLQFVVDKQSTIIDFFEAWLNRIVNRDSYGGADMNSTVNSAQRTPYEVAYKDTYACSSVNVFVYDRSQNNVLEYNIYDVFPTGIQSMNLSWSEENSLMRLNVTFSFTDLRIRPKVSLFGQDAGLRNGVATNETKKLQDVPISVATLGDVPLVQPGSIQVPADLVKLPVVIGDGDNNVPRTFGTPNDTAPVTASTPEVPTPTTRNTYGVAIGPV